MKQNSELDKWCKAQERFLRQHLNCLRRGRIRVHMVENNRFIDATDDIAADFQQQLANLLACVNGRNRREDLPKSN